MVVLLAVKVSALVDLMVQTAGTPEQPGAVEGMWKVMVSPEPSALARATAQRSETAAAAQGGARSAVMVTVRVVAAFTGCVGALPGAPSRVMARTVAGIH